MRRVQCLRRRKKRISDHRQRPPLPLSNNSDAWLSWKRSKRSSKAKRRNARKKNDGLARKSRRRGISSRKKSLGSKLREGNSRRQNKLSRNGLPKLRGWIS